MAPQCKFDLQKLRHRGHDVLSAIAKTDVNSLNGAGAGNASTHHNLQFGGSDAGREGLLPQIQLSEQQTVGRRKRFPAKSTGSQNLFLGSPGVATTGDKISFISSSAQTGGLQSAGEPKAMVEPAYIQSNYCRNSSVACPCAAVGNANGPLHYEGGAIFATVPIEHGEHPLIQTFFINQRPVAFHGSDQEEVVYSL